MTHDDLIEKYAIRCALGNNGGTWAEHYVEKQKEFWRKFVRDLLKDHDESFKPCYIVPA